MKLIAALDAVTEVTVAAGKELTRCHQAVCAHPGGLSAMESSTVRTGLMR